MAGRGLGGVNVTPSVSPGLAPGLPYPPQTPQGMMPYGQPRPPILGYGGEWWGSRGSVDPHLWLVISRVQNEQTHLLIGAGQVLHSSPAISSDEHIQTEHAHLFYGQGTDTACLPSVGFRVNESLLM